MNFPTLVVGQADPTRGAMIAQAIEAAQQKGERVEDVAARLGVTRNQAIKARDRHIHRAEYDCFIVGPDGGRVKVCHIITSKSFHATMIGVYRNYKRSLERLSLPWTLCASGQRVSLTTLQHALGAKSLVDAKTRKAARDALGLRA